MTVCEPVDNVEIGALDRSRGPVQGHQVTDRVAVHRELDRAGRHHPRRVAANDETVAVKLTASPCTGAGGVADRSTEVSAVFTVWSTRLEMLLPNTLASADVKLADRLWLNHR